MNTELQNFQDSVNEKIKNSKAEAEKLETEIKDLKLKKDFDVAPAYDEAEEAYEKAETSRVSAYKSCDCANVENDECTMLDKAVTNPEPNKSKPSRKKNVEADQ